MVDNVAFWLYQIISVVGFDTSFFSIQYFLVLSSFIFFFLWWKETIYGFQRFISLITNKFWFMVICLLYPCSCVCKNLCYTILSFFFTFIIFRQLFNVVSQFSNIRAIFTFASSNFFLHVVFKVSKGFCKGISCWSVLSLVSFFSKLLVNSKVKCSSHSSFPLRH